MKRLVTLAVVPAMMGCSSGAAHGHARHAGEVEAREDAEEVEQTAEKGDARAEPDEGDVAQRLEPDLVEPGGEPGPERAVRPLAERLREGDRALPRGALPASRDMLDCASIDVPPLSASVPSGPPGRTSRSRIQLAGNRKYFRQFLASIPVNLCSPVTRLCSQGFCHPTHLVLTPR